MGDWALSSMIISVSASTPISSTSMLSPLKYKNYVIEGQEKNNTNVIKNKNDKIHKNKVLNIGIRIPIKFPSKEIGLLWSRQSFGESTISDLESPSNFQVNEKN